MSYPVGNGTKEDFNANWKVDGWFGDWRENGQYYHEALDINFKDGGDSDIGMPLRAIKDGQIVYYHNNSHPNANFGRHMVYKISTPRGDRWVHYAHCLEITAEAKSIKEGDIIAKIGKSGTTLAHLHIAIFKVDPSTLRNGIDTVAKTKAELIDWWEDPFITFNEELPVNPNQVEELQKEVAYKNEQIANLEQQVAGYRGRVTELEKQNDELSTQLGTCRSEKQAMASKIESQVNIIEQYNKEDAVQISDLVTAQRERNEQKAIVDGLLSMLERELKLDTASTTLDERISAVREALASLTSSTNLLNSKVADLEAQVKRLNTQKKPIDKLTNKDLIYIIINRLLKRS